MSTYRKIHGRSIQAVTTDPSESVTEGQIWYNTTSDTFKTVLLNEAWSSGSSMTTARRDPAGFGAQNAAVGAAGYGGSGYTNVTEEYNGSGWAAGTAYPGAVASMGSTGSQTAGLVFGASGPGTPNSATYEYDGSSWTAGGSLGTGRYDAAGAGIQTAALAYGGSITTNVESYNGSSWTATTALNTARRATASVGIQTAALAAGGKFTPNPTSITSNVEEWNGSSWTEVNNLPAPTFLMGSAGIQTDALVFGGSQGAPVLSTTSGYDGTNWSAKPNMATARDRIGSGQYISPSSAAIAFAGNDPNKKLTEEFTASASVITAAAFSSGGVMPEATSSVADGGTATAAVKGAGQKNNPDSTPTSSAEYNGTSWTTGNTVPAPYGSTTGGTGTQTALITGGKGSGSTINFEYDGTNWTTGGSLGTGRYQGKNLGTQTAAAYCGGRVSPPTLNNVEEYDGSSWTSVTAMPIAIRNGGGYGIQTAGVIVSGFQGPSSSPVSPASSVSRAALGFNYDGTNWTTGTSSNIAGASGGAAGIQTVGFFLAGENPALSPSSILTSQTYDGTSYTTSANTTRSRATNFGITSSRTSAVGNAAAIFGGTDPAATPNDTAATEAYSVETVAANITDFTTS